MTSATCRSSDLTGIFPRTDLGTDMKRISLIVPCLNEEEAIPAFKQEIDRVFKECLEGYAPELIFVDDGSTDRSLEMIKKWRNTPLK